LSRGFGKDASRWTPSDPFRPDKFGNRVAVFVSIFEQIIHGPFIWNLLKRAGDRVVAAAPAQPSGYRPEMPGRSYNNDKKGWGPELCARRPDITMAMVDTFLTNMYGGEMGDQDMRSTPLLFMDDRSPSYVNATGIEP
jgi:hypothetical protein